MSAAGMGMYHCLCIEYDCQNILFFTPVPSQSLLYASDMSESCICSIVSLIYCASDMFARAHNTANPSSFVHGTSNPSQQGSNQEMDTQHETINVVPMEEYIIKNVTTYNGKTKTYYACNFPGCPHQDWFGRKKSVISHIRNHLQAKPYKCIW